MSFRAVHSDFRIDKGRTEFKKMADDQKTKGPYKKMQIITERAVQKVNFIGNSLYGPFCQLKFDVEICTRGR